MAADDKRLQALLGQFVPSTRDIVRRTPIAGDIERLESLLTLTPSNQSAVARRLHMEWTWEDALKLLPEEPSNEGAERVNCPDERSAHPAESTDTANVPNPDIVLGEVAERADLKAGPGSSDGNCHVVLVRLSELRPNSINATIYRESIDDKLLGELADHIAEYGQREPIIVDSTLMILSGERRWRALRLIADAEYARVVIDPTQRTADEVEDLVLDDFSLKRKPSVQEQLNVYDAAVRSYTRRSGRATGRPRKDDKNLSSFWDANRIRAEAAAAAGLGSRETVRHAKWVLKHGDAETKAAMLRREITINAAYVRLQEARDDEGGTDPEPPPQLPNGSSAHLRLVLPQPSSTEGEPQRAGATPRTAASSGEEQLSSGGVPAATPGGADSAAAHGHEGRNTGASEVPPTQTVASEASSPLPPREGAPGPNAHGPEVRPTASAKAKAVKKREHEPDARSFDRGITAAARYVSALRKRDEVEALSVRDKAIAILTAAANGDAETQVAGIDDEKTEGAERDSVLDKGGRRSSKENLAPDDAEVDLTVSPEEAEGESTSAELDNPDPESQEDAESDEADDDDAVNALVRVKKAEFDYSDYYDDDDGDESNEGHSDADDDEQVDSGAEENEDGEDELKDPLDAEVDELVNRSRARRV